MEGKLLRSKTTRVSKRKGKSSATQQTLLKSKSRTLQQRKGIGRNAAKFTKANESSSNMEELITGMSSSAATYLNSIPTQYSDLACKENVLDPMSNLCQGNNPGGMMKPRTSQQPAMPSVVSQPPVTSAFTQLTCSGGQTDVSSQLDCFPDHVFTPLTTVVDPTHLTPQTAECSTRLSQLNLEMVPYQSHFLSPPSDSPSPPGLQQQQQQQKSCKIRISNLLGFRSSLTKSRPPVCPLPTLQWTSAEKMWHTMRAKDSFRAGPEADLYHNHPEILPSMRIILLDWMMEVCEEYKVHRETYYLAVDIFDRFMNTRTHVKKDQLQLLGVSCLFIAAKIEEIYPPHAADFAYVTDGACSVGDLLDTELVICKVLDWKLNHVVVTPNTWINTYMQLASHHLRPSGVKAKDFDVPAFSGTEFTRVMKLLDLCTLDIASRQFGSSILAASAVYWQSEKSRNNLALLTGYELKDIQVCVNWMHPCAIILSQKPFVQKTFAGVPPHDTHNIQTHDISISMLEDAVELRKTHESGNSQYTLLQDSSILMTPPRTERRYLAPINSSC